LTRTVIIEAANDNQASTTSADNDNAPPLAATSSAQETARVAQAKRAPSSPAAIVFPRTNIGARGIGNFCSFLLFGGSRKMLGGACVQIFDRLRVTYVSRDLKT
jgi:hypothetical protein